MLMYMLKYSHILILLVLVLLDTDTRICICDLVSPHIQYEYTNLSMMDGIISRMQGNMP